MIMFRIRRLKTLGKILHFPTGKEITAPPKTDEELVEEIVREVVDIASHLFDVIDDEIDSISKHDFNVLNGINLRDEKHRESRDAFVVINMLYALLTRYLGIDHELHKDLDRLYVKIKAIHSKKEKDDIN